MKKFLKYKKLIIIGSSVVVASSTAAVVAVVVTKKKDVSNEGVINFDQAILYNGHDTFRLDPSNNSKIYDKTELIRKLEQRLLSDKSVKAFIFEGKKYQLADYADDSNNEVKKALVSLKITLERYFPSTFDGADESFVDTGKIVFSQKEFTLPYSGRTFDVLNKLPDAPHHTQWVASCPELYRTKVTEGVYEDAWYPLSGWRMPYNTNQTSYTFKVKLVPNTGYHIKDSQEQEIVFNNKMIPLLTQNDLTHMMKIEFDYSGENTSIVLKNRLHTYENLQITFNNNTELKLNPSDLNNTINVAISKDSTNKPFNANQIFNFAIKPSDFVKPVLSNATEYISGSSTVNVNGQTLTYYDQTYKVNKGVAPSQVGLADIIKAKDSAVSSGTVADGIFGMWVWVSTIGTQDKSLHFFMSPPAGVIPGSTTRMFADISDGGQFVPQDEFIKNSLKVTPEEFKALKVYDAGHGPMALAGGLATNLQQMGMTNIKTFSVDWEDDALRWEALGVHGIVRPTYLDAGQKGWYTSAPTTNDGTGKVEITQPIYSSKTDGEVTANILKAKYELI